MPLTKGLVCSKANKNMVKPTTPMNAKERIKLFLESIYTNYILALVFVQGALVDVVRADDDDKRTSEEMFAEEALGGNLLRKTVEDGDSGYPLTNVYVDKNYDASTEGFVHYVMSAVNWILGFMGAIAVIVVIISGVRMLFSWGDAGKARDAGNQLKYALIGLAVIAFSYTIVRWIVGPQSILTEPLS